jgi:hypothetical protein
MRLDAVLVVLSAAAFSGPAAAQSAAAQSSGGQAHVRGVVTRLEGDTLDVETGPGRTTKMKLPADAKVAAVEQASPDALTKGAFVGTAAVPQPDGTLRALEVHVFPEAMRGTGEGHRPWDREPGSSMTNAMVSGSKAGGGGKSSMTNGTVAGEKSTGGARTLTLTYPGGKQTVVVPKDAPIVKLEPGDRSLLVPGAHVFAIATAGPGGLVAQRLTVGRNGMVPPM